MTIKAVVFDLYGTLVPQFSGGPDRRDIPAMAAALDLDPRELLPAWKGLDSKGLGFRGGIDGDIRAAVETMGVEVDEDRLRRATEARLAFTRETLVPWPDAVETLRRLTAADLRLALCSNCAADVPGLFAETPLAPFFDPAVFSSEVHAQKPDPRIFRAVLDGLGLEGSDCAYVGDGYGRELTASSSFGMRAIHIRVPGETIEDTPEYEGDEWTGEQVAALSEVPALLGVD